MENATSPDSLYSQWYNGIHPDLTGHGLWLRGNEPNTLDQQEYHRRHCRLLIARLSTFFDTAGSFSHKILYQIAQKDPSIYPDFAFLPPLYDGPVFSRNAVPWLLGTTTKQGPRGFDLIAFSNAIVSELINVPVMLEKSNIPLKKSERLSDPSLPLIILGGSNSLYTSVFFNDEPPVDGIFFGESVGCIARIFSICAEAKKNSLSKAETLSLLESVPGFIQPDKPRKTERVPDASPSLNELLENAPVFYEDGQYGTGNLQISEGCPCFCSFCAESFDHKPYREVTAERCVSGARAMKAGMGLDKIELFSFNFNMHSEFYQILQGLAGLFSGVGLKSQRFDMLARDPDLLPACLAAGKTSITCGLEGISQRLRQYLHKSLPEKALLSSITVVLSSAVRELKVFLIITGLEDRHDLEEFSGLLRFMKDRLSSAPSAPKGPRIIFSATPLVRFPWTPLEFEDAPQPGLLRPIGSAIKGIVEAAGFEFRLSSDVNDYLLSQVLVRSNDPGIYDALVSSVRQSGFVYYRSVPSSFIAKFEDELAGRGLLVPGLLSGRPAEGVNLPWLFFETGVKREFILKQAEAARAGIDKGFSVGLPPDTGAASLDSEDVTPGILVRSPYRPSALAEKIKKAVASTQKASFLVELNDNCRGIPRAVTSVALASAIMKTEPETVPWYRGFASSFFSSDNGPCWIAGKDILTLLWIQDGFETIERLLNNPEKLAGINQLFKRYGVLKKYQPSIPDRYKLSVQSPYQFLAKGYFARHGLTHILKKSGTGYCLEMTKQALKKKLVFDCSYSATPEGGTDMNLTVSPKFNPEEFAKEAFTLDKENRWVRIRMKAEF